MNIEKKLSWRYFEREQKREQMKVDSGKSRSIIEVGNIDPWTVIDPMSMTAQI